ncbi:NADH-ubiquinone oxidoreductase, 20 kDa subunit [Desulfonema limicola]|uniref:NADH-ubiquinone oxidoreductase, 20 kDa subunit n=1 Tax=Desulfonema limicola TaxID=45656 RepID=A0A975BF29_9BACT|nr:NADH:ubiquinone oxidoreductase [Desulfonema limicola]QTA83935.1 NADH-ubiquinone oxidoreductase, 20 kDa subunit [Desulfonema limicola]
MFKTLYWLQCGGCGGDTMSFLSLESPDIIELFEYLGIEVLWHPSLSEFNHPEHEKLLEQIISGEQPLDILCVEGAVIRGPGGTGMFDVFMGRPRQDIVLDLAQKARFVVAAGTCASFGGITGAGDVDGTGLQYTNKEKGGLLGKDFISAGGLPVINIPGCPCHCEVLAGILTSLASNVPVKLTKFNAPLPWFGILVHQGCTRNEYHEYRVEENDFGEKGCLFFHMGCKGPLTYGPCNKLLWNRRNSKTNAGVPCSGCTHPDFPFSHPFFKTENIAGIPLELPDGVDRAHYLAYKGMAAAAAPYRLKKRDTNV